MSEPIPIAVAVVREAGWVLIGQRPPGVPLAGFWEFPGGRVCPGETLEEAARRECREETGLDVRIGMPYRSIVHAYEHGLVELHFFAATPSEPGQVPSPPYRWVPLSELDKYRFPLANAGMLAQLLATCKE